MTSGSSTMQPCNQACPVARLKAQAQRSPKVLQPGNQAQIFWQMACGPTTVPTREEERNKSNQGTSPSVRPVARLAPKNKSWMAWAGLAQSSHLSPRLPDWIV